MRTALIRGVLSAAILGSLQNNAHADPVIQALEERGFLPAPSIYVNKFTYGPTTVQGMPLGSGYVVRLPEAVRVQQVLAVSGGRSVILDITKELGAFRLSPEAVQVLGIQQAGAVATPVRIDIIALMRSGQLHLANPLPTLSGPERSPIPVVAPRKVASGLGHEAALTSAPELVRQDSTESNSVVSSSTPSGVPVLLALQAGYFGNEGNAKRFAETLRERSLPVRIIEHRNAEGITRWRVLAGPFRDKPDLEQARSKAQDLLKDAYQTRMP